jgi:hypothetical protein
MATARVTYPVGATTYEITIDSSGQADYPGPIIGPNDEIEFHNLAPYDVNIHFICVNGPVFNDILDLVSGDTSTLQAPQISNITTDYQIINASTKAVTELCSVEVQVTTADPAPLLIPITAGSPPADMQEVAIPINGWIQFDFDQQYDVSWSQSGVFPSGSFGPGVVTAWQADTGNKVLDVEYTLTTPTGAITGTVHINS